MGTVIQFELFQAKAPEPEKKAPPTLKVGARYYYTGDMANASGMGVIVEMSPDVGWGVDFTGILNDGRCQLGLTQRDFNPGIGTRFVLQAGEADANEIAEMVTKNAIMEAEEKAKQTEAANKFAAEVERLKGEYPDLIQNSGGADVAKNIRKLLKAKFPKVKFSVRRDGNAIYVKYADGPDVKAVDEVAGMFEAGYFNGMEDIYEYERTPFTELFGSVKYVFVTMEGGKA